MTDMPETSPVLGLPFYQTKLNEFEVQHNEALLILDALVMLAVIDRDLSAPPESPALGDRYLVKPTGTGEFAGQDNRIAQYDIGGWNFYAPRAGWTCYVQDECVLLAWDGEAWGPAFDMMGGGGELQDVGLLGIGTEADATNPLSAKLNNVLWAAKTVAEGGDGTLRYKLSKESDDKTLSFLFQVDYSGRAEIGLTGDDDFHFKTSPDGSTWTDALTLDKTTGAAKLNSGLFLTADIAPSQITADQNDYNPAGLSQASVLRLSTDASRNLTGLSGGGDGRVVAIVNAGSNAIVLKDASTSSSAANRLAFGADVTLAAKQSAVLWYDATDSRWKLLAGPQASGGGSSPADLDITLAELALALADAANVAQFLGSAGNRFADSFDALTYVDTGAATNLDTGTAGQLKPTVASGSYGSDLTAGTTPTASSGNSPGNGNDDNTGTYFPAPGLDVATGATWRANIASPAKVEQWTFRTGTSSTDVGRVSAVLLQGYDGSTWTTVDTLSGALSTSTTYTRNRSNFTNATTYQDYRLNFTLSANASAFMAEGELMTYTAGSTNNLTVASAAMTAAAAPSSMKIVAQVEETDAITLNTDLVISVSRDGGTTFSTATMSDRFTVSSIHVLESTAIDVSGQPSGTSVKWKIATANNKIVKIHGIHIYWT